MTEQEMRDQKVPTPKTLDELKEYIEGLMDQQHDYGTCVYAISMSATATFNYVASILGVTGFQAACADLDIFRRTRMMEDPFIIIRGEELLYPQYDVFRDLDEWVRKCNPWAIKEAKKKLAGGGDVHPDVLLYWQAIAAAEVENTDDQE